MSKERANNPPPWGLPRCAINRSVTMMVASRANRRRRSNSSSLYTAGGSSERFRDFREEPMSGQHLERRADTFQVGSPVDLEPWRQLKWQFCPGHCDCPTAGHRPPRASEAAVSQVPQSLCQGITPGDAAENIFNLSSQLESHAQLV